ncbi:helix-turn-helix domain-containing protein [Streptomyces sp. NBC_01431]|uniref:helix-turn-helix domain-containing protein n=1 Tax=Streptomyces sp. NBC_01431 TaxID=2903863 RepID=UPI002E314A6A|nr:MerR family transcriptional regulator [Streptomyces sp. NBC_01431]
MIDDGPETFTIGQLARRTGMAVRTIRYWSDIGALPPLGRSHGGYRLYDAGSVARLELVRTLRELGLSLDDVRRVLAREITVAEVAAAHVAALDAQIRALRVSRAVLSTIALRQSDHEEMTLMNTLARLSARERKQIIDDFTDDVFAGLDDTNAHFHARVRGVAAELPDDPTPRQVDAWIELAELVEDDDFRALVRRMAEANSESFRERSREPQAYLAFAKKIALLAGGAQERGIAPESPEADALLSELLGQGADRAALLDRLGVSPDLRVERYFQLLAIVNGYEPSPSAAAAFQWLAAALRAHLGG